MSAHQVVDAASQARDEFGRVFPGGDRFESKKPCIHSRDGDGGNIGLDIDTDDSGALSIEVKERGFAAPREVAHSAFHYPMFADQLFSDGRDGASLESGAASEASPRDGLVAANQVEHDTAVDVAGRSAAGNSKVVQVYFSHLWPSSTFGERIISLPRLKVHQKQDGDGGRNAPENFSGTTEVRLNDSGRQAGALLWRIVHAIHTIFHSEHLIALKYS
jgi:hypothetical protein